ncbi:protein MMS22-like [Chelonus insularis]|uniref:protein MMS22-like n=1 Tax=Chelonus insularis TaxID=460826 RepID=UPI001588B50F|nr:protein MMS22-like [Chelonus insularis]
MGDYTFNCTGKVNINDFNITKSGFMMKGVLESITELNSRENTTNEVNVKLFDHDLPTSTSVLHLEHLIKCMEMQLRIINRYESFNMQILDSTPDDQIDLYSLRKSICDFVFHISLYMKKIESESIRSECTLIMNFYDQIEKILIVIRKFINRLRSLSASIFYYAVSNIGNKCVQAEFHLYHMHLELRWLLFILVYIRASKCNSLESSSSINDLHQTFELIIDDLIYISYKVFERINTSDLRIKSPYTCSCVRELWLIIQILIEKTHDHMNIKDFWEYINLSLEKLPKQKNEMFSIWMIYHLTILQGYNTDFHYIGATSSRINPNYDKIERILKSYSNRVISNEVVRDDVDEELKILIPLLKTLSLEWWPFKVMVINYLWECFHRRLDRSFLTQYSGLWTVSIDKKSPHDILKQVKERISNHGDQNESSYAMFLRFLGMVLLKKNDKNDSKYWHQMKGRICSKFTKAKVAEFGQSALVNFISLFLTVAVTTDAANVCSIMLNLLPDIHPERDKKEFDDSDKKSLINWNGQLVVLIIYMENNLNFEKITNKLIEVINLISCRKNELSRNMMANYVDTLNYILESSDKLECGEYHLIGGWVDRYLLECPKNRIGPILKMLAVVFEKAVNISSSCGEYNSNNFNSKTISNIGATKMLETLWSVVAGRIRTMIFDHNLTGENFQEISRLAVDFTVEACRNPSMASAHRHSATSLFLHFTSTINVKDARIIKYYVSNILNRPEIINNFQNSIKNFNIIIIQAWLKCCIHGQDGNDTEMKTIKNFLLQLNDIQQVIMFSKDTEAFINSQESLLLYIMACAKKRNNIKETERNNFDIKIRGILNNLDKWALFPIQEETKDTELAFWIYRCLGTIFLCCATMLHSKSQSSMLRNFINKFILPSNEQLSYLKYLGKKIFSMIILGFESINAKNDIMLKNMIHELFQAYLPLLITENDENNVSFKFSEPLMRCFTDAQTEFVEFIFDILSTGFIKIASDNSMPKYSYLVMALLNILLTSDNNLNSYNNTENHKLNNFKEITEFILSKCTNNIIEAYIKVHGLHPHRAATINFVKNVVTNHHYKNNILLRDKFQSTISTVLINHVLSHSQAVLQFMKSISGVDIEIVKFIIPQLEVCAKQWGNNRVIGGGSLRYLITQLYDLTKK